MTAFLPSHEEIRKIADLAELRNTHPNAHEWLTAKIVDPPADWDERAVLTVPGVVWTVASDTCATGRLSAPDNVAYDHYWREFVFRQPRNEAELAAVMSADSEEVFACYRFDGLSRWTSRSVQAWMEDMDVLLGYVRHVRSTVSENMPEGLDEYETHLLSAEFRDYLADLQKFLEARSPAPAARRQTLKERRTRGSR